jgi:hypothetical protein
MLNLVNHPFHGTDPAKYGVKAEPAVLESEEGLRPGEMLTRKKASKQQLFGSDVDKSNDA